MAWFDVDHDEQDPGIFPFGTHEKVSLCLDPECVNGPVQTAARMGWEYS